MGASVQAIICTLFPGTCTVQSFCCHLSCFDPLSAGTEAAQAPSMSRPTLAILVDLLGFNGDGEHVCSS